MLSTKEPRKASISEHSNKHFRIATTQEESASVDSVTDESLVRDYLAALSSLINVLENQSDIEIGRCLDPTSPVPSQCKNFQIRHRSSFRRQTGYFDKCEQCTEGGKDWQGSREEEGITWEQLSESSSRGQKVKRANTGLCSTHGCDECRSGKA